LLFLAIISSAIGSCLESYCLCVHFEAFPLGFPLIVSVSSLIFEITLSWFGCSIRVSDLISVFYQCISCFPSAIYWRGCLFSIMIMTLLLRTESDSHSYVDLFLNLLLYLLISMSFFFFGLFLELPNCFSYYGLWYNLKLGIVITLALLFCSQDWFVSLESFVLPCEF
jgi:hypothetical protein